LARHEIHFSSVGILDRLVSPFGIGDHFGFDVVIRSLDEPTLGQYRE
jgi:hypothetical protein